MYFKEIVICIGFGVILFRWLKHINIILLRLL